MKTLIQDRINAPILAEQEKMREQAKIDKKQNAKSIDDMRKSQENLREKFIQMNNFMCEYERKTAILEKKIAIEEAADRQLDKEIKKMEEQLKRMNEYETNELDPAIAELMVYEEKVQEIVDKSDLFKTKEDFIDSCDALSKFQSVSSNAFFVF